MPYAPLVQPLMGKKLKKSKKVFDTSKVTDHHAIIPTGQNPQNVSLTIDEKRVFDLVARRFIAVFYPDCKFSTTTVLGAVKSYELGVKSEADAEKKLITHNSELITEFKASGKQILEEGWRTVFGGQGSTPDDEGKKDDEQTLPAFT